MGNRHQEHMTAEVGSVLGIMSAFGPGPFLALCALGCLAAVGLQVAAHPGPFFFGACILILPIVAWRVGSVPAARGGYDRKRVTIAGALLFGAVTSYQVQWGTVGGMINAARADSCRGQYFGPTAQGASSFLGCKDHLTQEQVRNACTTLMHFEESRTWRVRLAC